MPRIAHRTAVIVACAVVSSAGCRHQSAESAHSGDSAQAASTETAAMPEKPPQTGAVNYASTSVPKRVITNTVNDLAGRLGVPNESISVLKSVPVVWNDSSLGCPAPDMAYAQVLTPGFWTILEAGGELYGYHASERGQFRLCETIRPDPDGPPPGGRYAGEAS